MVKSIWQIFGESATRAALVLRVWGVASGPVTAFLILTRINAIDQGYYFAFLSLGSIVMFFELGFGQIVVQSIAHQLAVAGEQEDGPVERLAQGEGRLVVAIARYWYHGAGLLFAFAAVTGGWWWFGSSGVSTGNWRLAWVLYVTGMGANLALSGSVTVIEGIGEVALVYRLRLFSSVAGSLGLWATITANGGYYGLAVQQLIQFAITFWLITAQRRLLGRLGLGAVPIGNIARYWRDRLWPLQWRSAIVVASSFFIFQGTTLIAFRVLGPVEGGKVGFAMTIGMMLASLVILAVSVNAVKLGALAAGRNWVEFDRWFRIYLWSGLLVGVIGAVAVDGLLWLATRFGLIAHVRLLPQVWLWCVFLASLVAALVQAVTIRMRCLRQEPFALQNLAVAVVWPLVAAGLGTYFGVGGVTGGYLVVLVLGLALPVYLKFRIHERNWRAS